MAIAVMPYYALVLRPIVSQEISNETLKWLLTHADRSCNFDGEIMVFGAMENGAILSKARKLEQAGYMGSSEGDEADFVLAHHGRLENCPSWLTTVNVKFFDTEIEPFQAWKFSKSDVYDLLNFHRRLPLPMKGYQCDWEPFIGQINPPKEDELPDPRQADLF